MISPGLRNLAERKLYVPADLPPPKDWRRSWLTTFRSRQFATCSVAG